MRLLVQVFIVSAVLGLASPTVATQAGKKAEATAQQLSIIIGGPYKAGVPKDRVCYAGSYFAEQGGSQSKREGIFCGDAKLAGFTGLKLGDTVDVTATSAKPMFWEVSKAQKKEKK